MDAHRFNELWCRSGGGIEVDEVFEALATRYQEPHRHYHTGAHVQSCLDTYDWAESVLGRSDAVEMALWFHDVVYCIGRSDNEAQSAEFFSVFAGGHLSGVFINKVTALIMATCHRELPAEPDSRFVADVDLAELARPWRDFMVAYRSLCAESVDSADADRLKRQQAFFKRLLGWPSIFGTTLFQSRYERVARENIQRLLFSADLSST